MARMLVLILITVAAFAAADPWDKVREIKSGAEVRIFKSGGKPPVLAKFDELTEENLIVVVKNEQTAIPRDQIDRIDARPAQTGSRVVKETRTTTSTEPPGAKADPIGQPKGAPGPSSSTSSTLSMGSKPDFETVYRRTAAGPRK